MNSMMARAVVQSCPQAGSFADPTLPLERKLRQLGKRGVPLDPVCTYDRSRDKNFGCTSVDDYSPNFTARSESAIATHIGKGCDSLDAGCSIASQSQYVLVLSPGADMICTVYRRLRRA